MQTILYICIEKNTAAAFLAFATVILWENISAAANKRGTHSLCLFLNTLKHDVFPLMVEFMQAEEHLWN